ncbi:hypothetical protein Bca52824_026637 [Brassica carinata]|uniref:Uncharacterized protein n=1 Tax=Brassica carinata TaxID=52824 RepID=A0A8X7SH16_BRACI|nr:hypothetical protein Bca52824_026637 [Brassica carinata]
MVQTRFLRFWEACNLKKGGELMGINMLLLDAKAMLIQGLITVYRPNPFRHILHEGSVYELNGFDVPRSNPTFKFVDAAISIRFTDQKVFAEVTDTTKLISRESFRSRNTSSSCHLPIQTLIFQPVCLSVFDGLAADLDTKLLSSGGEPMAVFPTNTNPKFVRRIMSGKGQVVDGDSGVAYTHKNLLS